MKKILYFCKIIYNSINSYLTNVDKALQEIRDRGMGGKS